MSRIGNRILTVPTGVEIKLLPDNSVTIRGKHGTLQKHFDQRITIKLADQKLTTTRPNDQKPIKMLHGTTNALLKNMIDGVVHGFLIELQIVGVGYRAQLKGQHLQLNLGYSHPVLYEPPTGVTINVPRPTVIEIRGADKQLVGEAAATIRQFHPPEVYKGKGIRYKNEAVIRKEGKAAGK